MSIILVFVAALAAFSISLVSGGGAGLLLIPILGYFLHAAQVPAALSVGTSISSITKIALFYKNIRWPIVKVFLPTALLGVVFGAWLLSYLNPMYIELCMAIFLVSNLPFIFRKSSNDQYKSATSKLSLSLVGLFAGFISGLTGAVGVLFNRVYLSLGLSNQEVVATRAANEIMLHLIKLLMYGFFGLLTQHALQVGLIVATAAVLSTWVMKYVLPKISVKLFYKIGYSAMVISGIFMLNSAVVRIQAAHDPGIEFVRKAKGFDTALTWNNLIYTVEFEYGEGFEFEKFIPFSSLSIERKNFVLNMQPENTRVFIEKVYSLKKISYEAYFYNDKNQIVKHIDLK